MITRENIKWRDLFDRAQTFTTTPGMNGWVSKLTKTSGSPTSLCVGTNGGSAVLTQDATSEVQALTLYQNDVKNFQINQILRVRWILNVATVGSNTTVIWGIAGAQNDALASITRKVLFKILGSTSSSNVVIDSSDGTNTNTSVATGSTLSSTDKEFIIDFQKGQNDVRFFLDGDRVAAGTTFDMSANTTDLYQPYLSVIKASSTDAPVVTAKLVEIEYKIAYGA